jgi:HK97 family phage major capsid protein
MADTATLPTSAELRTRCTELAAKLIDQRSVAADKRDDTWANDVRETAAALHDYSSLTDVAERNERQAFEQAAWDHAVAEAERRAADPSGRGSRGPGAAFDDLGGDARTAGQLFTESDAYTSQLAADGTIAEKRSREVEVRNLLTGSSIGTSGSNLFAPVGTPTLAANAVRRMRLFVRDLIPVQQTGLQSIPYIRELNAATNETGATTVSEASAKPEVTMQFEQADAAVRKIAAWIQVTEEAYADAPTLQGYVDTRLAYMLAVEEEDQILNGNGTAPNISGILDQTGVQTQAAVAEDLAATIGLAAAKIENVDGFMDGVAINPITYWTGVVERHANQMDGGATNSGLPFADVPATIWGGPVVRTRALAVNKAIVGNWSIGATIFERMGTTIRSTDSHASLFVSNTMVVLAEKRTALAVHRPDFFVDTTLSFS